MACPYVGIFEPHLGRASSAATRYFCFFFPGFSTTKSSSRALDARTGSLVNIFRSSSSRTRIRPPAEVTREPWKSSWREALKET